MEWLPIETAPEDNIDVLLYNGADIEIGNRGANDKFFVNNELMFPAPTHWMAVPQPPTIAVTPEEYERLKAWKEAGEKIFEEQRWGMLFLLGVWWAERPWKNRV